MAVKTLTISEIAAAVGGELRCADTSLREVEIQAVFTDTRFPMQHGLFIALRGERFDGHDFIKDLEHTSAAAVLSEEAISTPLPLILVKNTGKALLDLASYYRSLFSIPVIALSGSVGKTTTKEMLSCVVGERFRTLKTAGNLNNEIGMPMTLLRMESFHEAAVIEMGMNHFGEISRLSKCAKPTMALITNIGVSHIEYLGSRENILKAKLEILEGTQQGAPVILNGDDDLLSTAGITGFQTIYFGIHNPSSQVRACHIVEENGHTSFLADIFGTRQEITLPTVGIHNVYNALAACAVGSLLEIPPEKIASALKSYVPAGMRQRMKQIGGVQVVEDCYNASPDSVKAAINVLSSMRGGKKIAVLGDMLELGDYSKTAHGLSGDYAAKAKVDLIFTYGERSKETAKAAMAGGVKRVYSFTDGETLAEMLAETVEDGDAVLFKASRGMQLENVMNKFYELLK
ncbi:MAG: UDP-N-acetylmuramoyl-tripeptide--D-alanyl-D-alanine ligase [Oscillospiraceae bacterium]|jgi:UDP-N-acetylmuramoyl-tripeptide--D-alanyl-D-alanine ligase|nr:UDP-N-acetylmuramoyl-tripeptide--D-alanyl-D-alanine ligase [Oscillospiraceae bacterium]